MTNPLKNPCYQCKDRQIGCHATCERYKKRRNENIARKRAIREAKANEYDKYEHDKLLNAFYTSLEFKKRNKERKHK